MNIIRYDYDKNTILITIMVINYCNYKCQYCIEDLYINNFINKIDFNLVLKLFDYIHSVFLDKNINVEIYGGEPTLHNELINFCKYIREHKKFIKDIDIYTNFSASDNIYFNLLDLDCHLSLTLHYSQIDSLIFIEKFNRCFNRYNIKKNLISINIMFENKSSNEILKIYNFFKTKNIKLELGYIFSTKKYKSIYTKKQKLEFQLINRLHNEKFNYIKNNEFNNSIVEVNISDILDFYNSICSAGLNSLFISPDNKIYPCNIYFREKEKIRFKGIPIQQFILNNLNLKNTKCKCHNCLPCIPIKILNFKNINFIKNS